MSIHCKWRQNSSPTLFFKSKWRYLFFFVTDTWEGGESQLKKKKKSKDSKEQEYLDQQENQHYTWPVPSLSID